MVNSFVLDASSVEQPNRNAAVPSSHSGEQATFGRKFSVAWSCASRCEAAAIIEAAATTSGASNGEVSLQPASSQLRPL